MVRNRRTKRYCSEACRKAAQRAAQRTVSPDEAAQNSKIIAELKLRKLVGQVWPVFSWDDSPPVFALAVPRTHALAELKERDAELADSDLVRALRAVGICDYDNHVEPQLIRDFYQARRDRRLAGQNSELGKKIPPPPFCPAKAGKTSTNSLGEVDAVGGGIPLRQTAETREGPR
jgi:hypothetical protein